MKETNLEEKIRVAQERILELNVLIDHWREQNDKRLSDTTTT